jgi:hypothetical protein
VEIEVHAGWGNTDKIAVAGRSDTAVKESSLEPVRPTYDWSEAKFGDQDLDFGEVKDQQRVKRAVESPPPGGAQYSLTIGPMQSSWLRRERPGGWSARRT